MKRVEKHLYATTYQTKRGEWSTRYYAIFVCWDGKKRLFTMGGDLQSARDKLGVLHKRNDAEYDFDKEKFQGMTFSAWATRVLELERHKRSAESDERRVRQVNKFFGPMRLGDITRATVMEYRNLRLMEPIVRKGKAVAGSRIKESTINRELGCVRHLLKLAAGEGMIDAAPVIKLASEKKFRRNRILSDEEYTDLIKAAPRYLQRVLIGFYETAMRKSELINLTWDKVDERAGVIRLGAADTKENDKRLIPITPQLRAVLDELKPNSGAYLTWPGGCSPGAGCRSRTPGRCSSFHASGPV
jgi:integrase